MPNKGEKNIRTINESIVRNPSTTMPYVENPEDSGFVWIHLNARKIIDQFSKGQGKIFVREGAPEAQYAFLAPLSLNENVVHTWSDYDSIASRIAQKVRSAAKVGAEYQALVGVFGKEADLANKFKNAISLNAANAGNSISNFTREAYKAVPGHHIPKIKVDTPLYYENSNRRQLTIELLLYAENDPSKMIDIVKDLMKLSSPALLSRGGVDIEFPYMFEIFTRPEEFIKYTTVALTGVQPTWNAPYIQNFPASCNLQLTFMDMSPLYRDTIEHGSVIRVIGRNDTRTSNSPRTKKSTPVNKYVVRMSKGNEARRLSRYQTGNTKTISNQKESASNSVFGDIGS